MIHISKAAETPIRITELINNLIYLYGADIGSRVVIDSFGFVTPLAITPLAAVINQKKLQYDTSKNTSYLHTINFPEGQELVDYKEEKSYFPIIHVNLRDMANSEQANIMERLHTCYLELLRHNVVADEQFLQLITNNTFGFLLGEILTNIQEHAQAENAYVFAQYWKKNNVCEICVLDDGQGMYASLKNAGRTVSNSQDALLQVMHSSLSAKDEAGTMYRGTGLKHTRSCITSKEIHGEFFIMSGDAAFLHSAQHGQTFYPLSRYYWQGTMVVLRIHKPVNEFNIYDYVK